MMRGAFTAGRGERAMIVLACAKCSRARSATRLHTVASPGLRKCLDQAIRGVTLPADTEAGKVTLPIPLGQGPAS